MASSADDDHLTISSVAPARNDSSGRRRDVDLAPEVLLSLRHRGGTEAIVLRPGQPIVVGRQPPATVCIADRSLSRIHARFFLSPSGQTSVEDLESTNGTSFRGARVTSAEILPGEEVALGDVIATVYVLDPPRSERAAVAVATDEEPIAIARSMRALMDTAERLAASPIPVVIHGETGTGKEVLARFLHENGPARRGRLVCVNCASIPEALVESVLFGHERGAFTGAGQQRKGIFEEAHGGTVFLDEIGELPGAVQAALLRVLEAKVVTRIGSVREIPIEARVVAATHRDLEVMVEQGTFRADLYHRLATMVLEIPPLRDRPEEVEAFARRFLARAGHGRLTDIAPSALELMRAYRWPGNVRELRNVVERALVVARGHQIEPEDLPAKLRASSAPREEVAIQAPLRESEGAAPTDYRDRLLGLEARMLKEALDACGWSQSEAARRLGVPARTLSNKIKAFGLKRPAK